MRHLHYLYLLLVMTGTLSGCISSGSTPSATPNTPAMAILTATTIPTATPMTTETLSPSPMAVPPTSTSIPIPTHTATWTPPPTLEPEQAEEVLRALLREPGDCLAPCFWEIVLGQTMLSEAENIFTHLGLRLEFTIAEDNKEFYAIVYDFDSGLSITIILGIQDETVENLNVSINPEKHKAGVPREWLAYSPETLINLYGPPSKVDFFLSRIRDGNADPRTWYDMILYFATVDLIIEYGFGEIYPDNMFQVCPLTDQFDSVRIWLGQDLEHPPFAGVPLEEATVLTVEDFAGLMTGDPENACFELKMELFP